MNIYKIEEGGETDFVEADSLADALLRWRDHCVRTRDAVADIEPDSVRRLGYGESLLARDRPSSPIDDGQLEWLAGLAMRTFHGAAGHSDWRRVVCAVLRDIGSEVTE